MAGNLPHDLVGERDAVHGRIRRRSPASGGVTGRSRMLWMFGGVLLVATLTAEVTAEVTVAPARLRESSRCPICTARTSSPSRGTTSDDFLREAGHRRRGCRQIPEEAVSCARTGKGGRIRLRRRHHPVPGLPDRRCPSRRARPAARVVRNRAPRREPGAGGARPGAAEEEEFRENGSYDRLVRAYFG